MCVSLVSVSFSVMQISPFLPRPLTYPCFSSDSASTPFQHHDLHSGTKCNLGPNNPVSWGIGVTGDWENYCFEDVICIVPGVCEHTCLAAGSHFGAPHQKHRSSQKLSLLHLLLPMAVKQQVCWQREPRAMGKARWAKDSEWKISMGWIQTSFISVGVVPDCWFEFCLWDPRTGQTSNIMSQDIAIVVLENFPSHTTDTGIVFQGSPSWWDSCCNADRVQEKAAHRQQLWEGQQSCAVQACPSENTAGSSSLLLSENRACNSLFTICQCKALSGSHLWVCTQ